MRTGKLALAAVLPALLGGLAIAPAHAGLVVVSGDENITDALVGSGTAVNPGNQAFFTNVLDNVSGAHSVLVQGTDHTGIDTPVANTNTFYNTLVGVTSTILTGPVTAASLSGVNLFVSAIPANAFSTSEVTALSNFSSAGGSIFLMGDGSGFTPTEDANLNLLLTGLGSSLSIVPDGIDAGFHTAGPSQIAAGNPLTAGVSSFTYTYVSQVSGGTSLFTASGGQTYIAATGIATKSTAVPESSSFALLALGLLPVGLIARKRISRRA